METGETRACVRAFACFVTLIGFVAWWPIIMHTSYAFHRDFPYQSVNGNGCHWLTGGVIVKQDSIAVAKKTARCAQYMGALKSFESPHYAPGYFSRNL